MKFPESRILVFCKAPIPGQVKTRLIPHLSAEEAAKLHRLLTIRTLDTITSAKLCHVELWASPSMEYPFYIECIQKYDITLRQQMGGDLGDKMHHAFQQTLPSARSVLLIGCDWVTLSEFLLEEALAALNNDNDVVLGPASDGGYVMIGLKQPQNTIFDQAIPWSTSQVLAETERRIVAMNLRFHKLPEQRDIDLPEDLEFLPEEIKKQL